MFNAISSLSLHVTHAPRFLGELPHVLPCYAHNTQYWIVSLIPRERLQLTLCFVTSFLFELSLCLFERMLRTMFSMAANVRRMKFLTQKNCKVHKTKLCASNPAAQPPSANLTVTTTHCPKQGVHLLRTGGLHVASKRREAMLSKFVVALRAGIDQTSLPSPPSPHTHKCKSAHAQQPRCVHSVCGTLPVSKTKRAQPHLVPEGLPP